MNSNRYAVLLRPRRSYEYSSKKGFYSSIGGPRATAHGSLDGSCAGGTTRGRLMPTLVKAKAAQLQRSGSSRAAGDAATDGGDAAAAPARGAGSSKWQAARAAMLGHNKPATGAKLANVFAAKFQSAAFKLLGPTALVNEEQRKAEWAEFRHIQDMEAIFHTYDDDGGLRGAPKPDSSFEPPQFRLGDISPYNSDSDELDVHDSDDDGEGEAGKPSLPRPTAAAEQPRPHALRPYTDAIIAARRIANSSGVISPIPTAAADPSGPAATHDVTVPTSILVQELLSAAREERAEWFDYEPNSNVWTSMPVKLRSAFMDPGSTPSHVSVREATSTR